MSTITYMTFNLLYTVINMDKLPTISVCILVNKDWSKLRDFILSVIDFADEIIIADRGSSGKKISEIIKEISKNHNIKIELYHYENPVNEEIHFGKAKNFAMRKATKDYIIALDADEIPSEEFKKNIKTFLRTKKPVVASVVRIDELIPHLIERVERIVKNGKNVFYGESNNYIIHEQFVHNHKTERFDPVVWHSQKETHWLQKPEQRLFLIVLEVERAKKIKSFMGHFIRGVWLFQFKFKKVYFKQKIYKDGLVGFKFAFMRASHDLLVELLTGLKPKEGYEYWKDSKWKSRIEKYKKEFNFSE